MNIGDVVTSLARRWYLTLAGVVATAVLVVLALHLVQPSYVSRANVVLLPPKSSIENGGNPYLQLGGLVPTLDLLSVSLADEEMKRSVETVSPGSAYEAVGDTTNAGPVLAVTATSSSPEGAVSARNTVVAQVPVRLAGLQTRLGIVERSQITSMVLTQDPVATPEGRGQLRAAVVAGGLGIGSTALGVALIDGVLARRRRRQSQLEDDWFDQDEQDGQSESLLEPVAAPVRAAQDLPAPSSPARVPAPVVRGRDQVEKRGVAVHSHAVPGRSVGEAEVDDKAGWNWGSGQVESSDLAEGSGIGSR